MSVKVGELQIVEEPLNHNPEASATFNLGAA
jgi:hypothetical protein